MCYITDGAQDYLKSIDDAQKIEFEKPVTAKKVVCLACDKKHEVEDVFLTNDNEDIFCKKCVEANQHIEFYKTSTNCADWFILELINNLKTCRPEDLT